MDIRRRTGEAVVSSSEASNEEDTGASSGVDAALERGKQLYSTARESGFKEMSKLVRGVDSFVHAAAEGSGEAVDWLKTFLVSPPTALDSLPTDLLDMMKIVTDGSEEEKEVCRVARQMFQTMSEGGREIPQKEIDSAAQHLMTSDLTTSEPKESWESKSFVKLRGSVKRLMNRALITNDKGIKVVTEERFIVAACQQAIGGPVEHSQNGLDAEQSQEFKRANWIMKFTNYPKETANYIGQYFLRSVEKNGVRWIWTYFSAKNFAFLFLVYFLPMVNISFILTTLATMLFAGAFLAMIISTIQVVSNSNKVYSLKEYWLLFRHFSTSEKRTQMDASRLETRMIKQLVYPYITYVIATLLALTAMSNAHHIALMHELLVFLSGALVLIIFIHFQCWKSPIILLSLSIRFLSVGGLFICTTFSQLLPQFLASGFASLPVIPGIVSAVSTLGTVIVGATHLALIVPFALNASWNNFFFLIGPYLLLTSWSVFMYTLLIRCTLMSIVSTIIGCGVLICMLPFTPVILVAAPVLYLVFYGSIVGFLTILASMIAVGLVALAIVMNYKRLKTARWLNIKLDYVILIQILISIPLLVVGVRYYNRRHHPSTLPAVELPQYGRYCGALEPHDDEYITRQAKCLALKGRVLSGKGVVESIELGDVINDRMNAMARFPKPVQTALTCLMGEVEPVCDDDQDPSCAFSGCHFHSSNIYNLQIKVALSTIASDKRSNESNLPNSVSISTPVRHSDLKNCSLVKLKSNDTISFNVTFISGMGSSSLSLGLISLISAGQGIEYTVMAGENMEDARDEVVANLWNSVVGVVRFIVDVFCGHLSVS